MELTIRDWMVVIGVLLIVAVLVDAWRRVRSDRHAQVRLGRQRAGAADNEERDEREHPTVLNELPNGGARVIRREDLLRAAREHGEAAAERDAQRTPVDADAPGAGSPRAARPETRAAADDGLLSGVTGDDREPGNLDWLEDLPAEESAADEGAGDEGRLPREPDPEVFLLHVVARDPAGFAGDDILQILLACDLRFGDMDFFHRHEQAAGRGPIQFSVANMMQPGVFAIDRMGELNTPGLLFFVTLPGPEDMMKAFDYMLETAQVVARNLDGEVLDESRSALTRQSLDHNRQKIRDLERRLLAGRR
jgi:cell division protein ZipA